PLDLVDLVAASRPELALPELARRRMNREAERVAMADRPDIRLVAVLADERVVLGHRAVVAHAHDLAQVRRRVLRPLAPVAVADRDEEKAVLVEHDSRAVAAVRWPLAAAAVVLTGHLTAVPRVRDEDVLDLGQRRAAIPLTASDGRRCERLVLRVGL